MDTLVVALRVALSLAVVVGLLWFMQRKATRSSRVSKNAQLISVVGRQGVGQKASVVVVDIDGQRFVLGVTEHNVSVLQSAAAPVAPVAPVAAVAALSGANGAATTSSADLFARTLDTATSDAAAGSAASVVVDAAAERSASKRMLDGSILSPATWKQTAAALRQHP